MDKDYNNHMLFAEQILSDFIDSVTGRNLSVLTGSSPDDSFFVGKLSSIDDVLENKDTNSNVKVNQMSVDFFIEKDSFDASQLIIKIRGDFYYRVLPTYEEQREYYLKELNKKIDHKNFSEISEAMNFFEENKRNKEITNLNKSPLLPKYNKFSLDDSLELKVDWNSILDNNRNQGSISFENKIIKYLDEEINKIMDLTNIYKVIRDEIKVEQLSNPLDYENFLTEFNEVQAPRPAYHIDVKVDYKLIGESKYRVSINLVNKTRKNDFNTYSKEPAYLPVLFNSGIEVQLVNAEFQDIDLDYFLNDYKYDKTVKGIGTNCSIEYDKEQIKLLTNNIPIFYQKRLKTRDNMAIKFDDLINDPIKTLNKISIEMDKEIIKWNKDFEARKNTLVSDERYLIGAQNDYLNLIKGFKFEVDRFKYGVEQIKNRDMVRKSFINMNKTFKNTSSKYSSWRLFQIVFIVSLIPDLIVNQYGEDDIDNSYIDKVDLLYFPTGGGKTEAFIGCIVFTLFFDRIRGKKSGVSSLVKYPLRLLSVQQIDRLANVLAAAEVIRQQCEPDFSGDRFSLGYYVGDNNTPNELSKEKIDNFSGKSQEQLDKELRIIDVCPFCHNESVNIILDLESIRLKHVCSNPNCPSGEELPIYIVDKEIYRYLPSVIISTIDKIASIGFQSNFRNILGEVKYECPLHGYTSKSKCTEKDFCTCDAQSFKEISLFDPAPSLIVQDELHLIRESLGTFNSHYETLFQYMISELVGQNKKLKIIGATATISNYASHISALYNKEGVRFPSESPTIGENFYSFTDDNDINRIIISYAPFGRSILNSVVFSLKYLRKILWKYYKNLELVKNIPGMQVDNDAEALEIVKNYWIFLQYNNVKIDGNRVINAIDNIMNPQLIEEGCEIPFDIRKMTGDETFQSVRQILAEIESNTEVINGVNLIAATSMISHGVDADRFNMMMFFGMPSNTAEYIQAYSRAGRRYPGIIIDIIRPTREKDMSYLKYFVKFHDYKDILVEPVPVNRWASKAVEKTLSGVLSAILINHYDLKYQFEYGSIFDMKVFKKLVEDGIINKNEIINHVKRAYGCQLDYGGSNNPSYGYVQFIEDSINKIFTNVVDKSFVDSYYYLPGIGLTMLDSRLSPAMFSLRYTDRNVNIELR